MEERFSILIGVIEKKINLEEKKSMVEERQVELATASEDTKILTMKMDYLDPDAAMIVQFVHVRMLK